MVYECFNFIQSRVIPPLCMLCSAQGQQPDLDLCSACEADMPANALACRICAHPLSGFELNQELICGACLLKRPRFHVCYSAFRYAFPIDHLVRGLKYREAVTHARVLGELLARHVRCVRRDSWPECLIPVPLASGRYRERGYNQAIELGRCLERTLGLPMHTHVVMRTRETVEQASLSQKERRKNVRRAFVVNGRLQEKHVAIIDDVVTTGSTVNEVARVLRHAGAKRVEVWAVARAAR